LFITIIICTFTSDLKTKIIIKMEIEIKNVNINFSVSEMTQEFDLQNDITENIYVIFDDGEIIFRNVVFFVFGCKYRILEIKTQSGEIIDWSDAYNDADDLITINDIEIEGLQELYSEFVKAVNEEQEIETQNKSEFIEHLKSYSK